MCDQVCDSCRGPRLPRHSIRNAIRRVAATQAKVAEEKKARVIAEVWRAIPQQKRKREEDETVSRRNPQTKQAQRPAPMVGTRRTVCGNRFYLKEGAVSAHGTIRKSAQRAGLVCGLRTCSAAFKSDKTRRRENNARKKVGKCESTNKGRRSKRDEQDRPTARENICQ